MDLTINPDFGQVEADPSEVNLSTYETFFPEKRPFFIEGKSILKYSLQFGDGDLAEEGLFYSRRIGRQPQFYPEIQDEEYTDVPEFTRIIGAAKITGKSPSGWSVGVLESVTVEENAEIKGINEGYTQAVEPLTNYIVTRIQKDFNEGNTYLGGMFTSVHRSINDTQLEFLHENAFTGGIDFVHKWDDKNWLLDAGLFGSQVNGTEEAILRTQTSMIRNFQRPDADYVEVDSTLTSLTGHGGKFAVGKVGGKFNIGTIFTWKSPGLELNDIGFAQQVDRILEVIWSNYHFREPFSIFRELHFNLSLHAIWDFGGSRNNFGGNLGANAQFTNYWHTFFNLNLSGNQLFNNVLRGGPALKIPGYKNIFVGTMTNPQKKLTFGLHAGQYFSNEKDFRTMTNLELEIGYNMSVRINYNITPDLTIQYWGQPFVATGSYTEFNHITDSKATELSDRYHLYDDNQISYDEPNGICLIDDNTDGTTDYSL